MEAKPTKTSLKWFPQSRFDHDFPLAMWMAGLWLYLKSFLYLCNLYSIGLDPTPYSTAVKWEIGYYALAFLPALLLGLVMWNGLRKYLIPTILFLLVDTPLLIQHINRLAAGGYLESDLTKVLEYGSLGLNFIALGWLIGYWSAQRARQS